MTYIFFVQLLCLIAGFTCLAPLAYAGNQTHTYDIRLQSNKGIIIYDVKKVSTDTDGLNYTSTCGPIHVKGLNAYFTITVNGPFDGDKRNGKSDTHPIKVDDKYLYELDHIQVTYTDINAPEKLEHLTFTAGLTYSAGQHTSQFDSDSCPDCSYQWEHFYQGSYEEGLGYYN